MYDFYSFNRTIQVNILNISGDYVAALTLNAACIPTQA